MTESGVWGGNTRRDGGFGLTAVPDVCCLGACLQTSGGSGVVETKRAAATFVVVEVVELGVEVVLVVTEVLLLLDWFEGAAGARTPWTRRCAKEVQEDEVEDGL